MTKATLARIRGQIERMRGLARSPEDRLCARNDRVSGWSPAEHLDHMCKVALSIVRRIQDKDAKPSPHGINVLGRVLLFVGRLPRGRSKAPERLTGAMCTGADIEAALHRFSAALDAMPIELTASRVPIVPHPRFGGLTPSQALRFLAVHTNHHLRIIDEVLGGPAPRRP